MVGATWRTLSPTHAGRTDLHSSSTVCRAPRHVPDLADGTGPREADGVQRETPFQERVNIRRSRHRIACCLIKIMSGLRPLFVPLMPLCIVDQCYAECRHAEHR